MKNFIILFLLIFIFKAEAQSTSALIVSKKADSLFEIGEYNKAIPFFLESKRYRDAAKSYQAVGNNLKAQHYFKKYLSENPNDSKAEFEFVKMLVRVSDYKKADSILQKLHLRFPNNPNFIYERGLIKEFQNDSTAIDLFRQVYTMDSNNVNAIYKMARNYVENREFDAAEPFIAQGLTSDENSIRFLILQALEQYHTQQFHEAIATYNLLISKGESYISLHENLAKAYAQTFQVEKALEQYNILFQKYDDQNPKWHHEVALLYRSNQDYKKSERHFNIAIGLLESPLSNEYYELSKLYGWNKDYKKEMETLRKAISNNPNNEMAQYYLAVAADNYYKDKKTVLTYYENYLKKFGETGRMRNLAKQRLSDLKNELHFEAE